MSRSKHGRRFPFKPIIYADIALVAGVVLVILSQVVKPDAEASRTAEPTTAPATGTDTPAEPKPDQPTPPSREADPNESLSGMLLLFGAACLVICVVCLGWFVVELRKRRPAWKTQSKFPKMKE